MYVYAYRIRIDGISIAYQYVYVIIRIRLVYIQDTQYMSNPTEYPWRCSVMLIHNCICELNPMLYKYAQIVQSPTVQTNDCAL